MCTVSNIGDQWNQTIPYRFPWIEPYIQPAPYAPPPVLTPIIIGVPQEEFDKLKLELEELKKLLRAAKIFDEVTGQPDCEVDEKVGIIKRIAELMDVDMEDILG